MDIYVVVSDVHGGRYVVCDWYGDGDEEERQEVFLTLEHAEEVAARVRQGYGDKSATVHKFEV